MKKSELLKQIELLKEEVEVLKAKVRQLEMNKKDRGCYPEYGTPTYPQYEYDITGRPRYIIADRNTTWD